MKPSSTLWTAFSALIFSLVTSFSSFAQGNLKFSEVKYITLAGTTNSSSFQVVASQTLVVPASHVLKIENIVGLSFLETSSNYEVTFCIDDIVYSKSYYTSSSGIQIVSPQSFPVWLPAGSYTLQINSRSFGSSLVYPVKVGFSALDFEVTP